MSIFGEYGAFKNCSIRIMNAMSILTDTRVNLGLCFSHYAMVRFELLKCIRHPPTSYPHATNVKAVHLTLSVDAPLKKCSLPPFWKEVYSKTKEFAPTGSKFFLFKADFFWEGDLCAGKEKLPKWSPWWWKWWWLRLLRPFNILVILRRWKGDKCNERFSAIKHRTIVSWILPPAGFEPGTS